MKPAGDKSVRVNVVIPNRNGIQHLDELFATLEGQTFCDFSVTFVDNASTDTSVVWVAEHYPSAKVIAREVDGGFSASVNDGIRASECEYVSILNNDVRLDTQWLARLVDELDLRPDYDFATPLLIMYYEPDLVNAAGDVFDLAMLGFKNRGLRRPVGEYTEGARVLGATANGVLYRRAFFEDVGLYDEDYYLQHEDSDINLRALIAGKSCRFVPESRLYHKIRSSASDYRSNVLDRLNYRNEGMVVGKCLPLSLLVTHFANPRHTKNALFKLFASMRWTWRFIPARYQEGLERNAQWLGGFRMGWRKRGDVWSRRRVSMREIRRWIREGVSYS